MSKDRVQFAKKLLVSPLIVPILVVVVICECINKCAQSAEMDIGFVAAAKVTEVPLLEPFLKSIDHLAPVGPVKATESIASIRGLIMNGRVRELIGNRKPCCRAARGAQTTS